MARLSQLLRPDWSQIPYEEMTPELRALVDNGALVWGSTTPGGDDPKTQYGWQVRDYSKIPTFADGTYFDNSNRDFNVHAGSWTDAGTWDNIVDPSRVVDDPNFGRVTTTDNAYDNKGIGDFMEKVVIGTILGGAGLMGAGMAGFAVPSWVTGAAGAAEGGAAGWATGAGLDGIAGDAAGSWLAPGGALTGGAGAGGALSAADAYSIAAGGEAATPFTSAAGAGAAGAGGSGWLSSVASTLGMSPEALKSVLGLAGSAIGGLNSANAVGRATEQTRAGISDAIGELQAQRQNQNAGYKPFIDGGLAGLAQLGKMGNGQSSLAGRYKALGSGRWRA